MGEIGWVCVWVWVMDESFTPKQKSLWLSSSARVELGRVSCVHSFDCWTRKGQIDWFQLKQINKMGLLTSVRHTLDAAEPIGCVVCYHNSRRKIKWNLRNASKLEQCALASIVFLRTSFPVAAIVRFHCLLVYFRFFGLAPLLPIMSK